ncbi:uncharacterized protein LOC105428693 [Pogonomyrmex barbatus]|uniref:RNA-directed DNA polymerase n=1 Tax=Pogonomyrmex barbatus TaxID=144034 RepID=A0A6I9WBF6_9HYME|nr:uncharacterized protein LOC105428693 [Pogonomyrmex barbatus]
MPKKVKDVQSFIGLAGYYRKFIEDFSRIAKPLTKLTKKGEKFEWTETQQNAFDMLKNKLTTASILKYPDFTREFLLTTDASDYAIGAVLSQGEKNKLQRRAKAPLMITDTPTKQFEKCALDIVGPLPVTTMGNKYTLTFQDNLTKFSKGIPVQNQEATTIAKELDEWIPYAMFAYNTTPHTATGSRRSNWYMGTRHHYLRP